jgi:hypothetical protein
MCFPDAVLELLCAFLFPQKQRGSCTFSFREPEGGGKLSKDNTTSIPVYTVLVDTLPIGASMEEYSVWKRGARQQRQLQQVTGVDTSTLEHHGEYSGDWVHVHYPYNTLALYKHLSPHLLFAMQSAQASGCYQRWLCLAHHDRGAQRTCHLLARGELPKYGSGCLGSSLRRPISGQSKRVVWPAHRGICAQMLE